MILLIKMLAPIVIMMMIQTIAMIMAILTIMMIMLILMSDYDYYDSSGPRQSGARGSGVSLGQGRCANSV